MSVAHPNAMPNTSSLPAHTPRHYRYYDLIMAAFVCILLCSNLIGAAKQTYITLPWIGTLTVGAGVLFFPISYFFGDILTEVYGYARDRRVVWAGFVALLFASLMAMIIVHLPPAHNAFMATFQGQLEGVFDNAWRIAVASIVAYWCGSFSNSIVLAKMKVATNGQWLWMRTIGSTAVGELIDSLLFYALAFYGVWTTHDLVQIALLEYTLKTLWEILATPLTYWLVNRLKAAEKEDYFDRDTPFTPFSLDV
ncbi:MAG TPA: queuosine precursor transporter [Ferrovaceae bacterium]|uniref:queuosine precursor transporter n=2 Tax=Ferrovum sp. JA12 TaxID=1356299 RepID=UPI001955D396|nr:queuosine precursor transporter [Ferrovum sp. JA12]HQT80628.1 queuosine precursor transporter [Ferrovaceae bacterium]